MANRIVLNETSYHGKGAIAALPMKLRDGALPKPLSAPIRIC